MPLAAMSAAAALYTVARARLAELAISGVAARFRVTEAACASAPRVRGLLREAPCEVATRSARLVRLACGGCPPPWDALAASPDCVRGHGEGRRDAVRGCVVARFLSRAMSEALVRPSPPRPTESTSPPGASLATLARQVAGR